MRGGLAAIVVTVAAGGCIVPFQTSAPPLASTVGQGKVGFAMHSELPTVDLLATAENADPADGEYEAASLPVSSFQLAYGIADKVDVEGGFEAVFLGIPLPIGVSAGARYQAVDGEARLAIAARVGTISGSSSVGDERYEASARYAQVAVATQLEATSWLRPGLVLTASPSQVSTNDAELGDFTAVTVGASASLTFVIGPVEIGPAINIGHLATDNLDGAGVLVSGGLYLGLRPQRRRAAP